MNNLIKKNSNHANSSWNYQENHVNYILDSKTFQEQIRYNKYTII